MLANPVKILTERGFGDEASDIGKGKTSSPLGLVPTLRIRFDAVGIYPGDGGGHHTEMQVVDHGLGVAALTFLAADVLLELFKSGFDFPPRAIMANSNGYPFYVNI